MTTKANGFYEFEDIEPGDVIVVHGRGYPSGTEIIMAVTESQLTPDGWQLDGDVTVCSEDGVTALGLVSYIEDESRASYVGRADSDVIVTWTEDGQSQSVTVPIDRYAQLRGESIPITLVQVNSFLFDQEEPDGLAERLHEIAPTSPVGAVRTRVAVRLAGGEDAAIEEDEGDDCCPRPIGDGPDDCPGTCDHCGYNRCPHASHEQRCDRKGECDY